MLRKLACLSFGLAALPLLWLNCDSGLKTTGDKTDMKPPINVDDLGGGNNGGGDDGAVAPKTYTDSSIHNIDTGVTARMSNVHLSGIIAVTPAHFYSSCVKDSDGKCIEKNGKKVLDSCTYEVWAQDPACSGKGCGIHVVSTKINPKTDANGSTVCPYENAPESPLKAAVGDILDVQGTVDIFVPSKKMPMTNFFTEHVVVSDKVSATGGGQLPAPVEIMDGSQFTSKNANGGYNDYEGMRVKIVGPLTVSAIDVSAPYHFHTTPGNADFSTTFRYTYTNSDAGAFPAQGQSFRSITAVVNAGFEGVLLPVSKTDFEQ